MKPLAALLVLSLATGAAGQTADQFGRSLKLPENSFESTRTSALLNLTLPREGVRLRSLSPLNATFLKRVLTDAPANYGYRCTGEHEVILFPGTADDNRAFNRQLLQQPGNQPLIQTSSELLFSANNVFARFGTYNGVLNLTTCRATRDLVSLKVGGAAHEAFVGSKPYLVSGDFAGHVNWCTTDAAPLRSLQAFTGSTLALDVSQDGTLVAAGGWDAKPAVKIYDATTGTLKQTLPLKDGPVSLTFSGDTKTLLVLDANRTYTWFDLANGKTLNTWTTPSQIISNLRGGGSHLFLEWSPGGLLRVYDAQKGRAKFSLRNYKLSGQTFTPDGQWIVTAGLNGILSSYNTQDGKPGPQVALGVVAGAGLMAGQNGAEVIALLQQNTEGQPSKVLTSAWKVGESTLTPRGTTDRRSGGSTVMNLAKTTPVSIALCRAP